MALLRPDPTFYASPRLAMQAPAEKLAYVAALNPPGSSLNDAILVIDVDPASAGYGRRVGQIVLRVFGCTMKPETVHDSHVHGAHSGHAADLDLLDNPWLAGTAVVVNTLGHLMVAALVATIVYEKLGVRILQRAWFNFDLAWAIALIVSGLVTALL
jgi:hypothetical protein